MKKKKKKYSNVPASLGRRLPGDMLHERKVTPKKKITKAKDFEKKENREKEWIWKMNLYISVKDSSEKLLGWESKELYVSIT